MSTSFDEVLRKRRSTRKFDGTMVSKEDLQAVVDAGTLAPCGMHRNELSFVALTVDNARRYLDAAKSHHGMDRYYGANSVILVLGDKSKADALYDLDIGAAMQNMLLKATDLNLQSCWVHAAIDLSEDKEVLDLLQGLGYPHENYKLMESMAIGHGETPKEKEVDESRAKVF